MEADVVTRLIQEAFPLQPIPKMTLHQAQLADQTMDREIPEKEWKDVGDSDAGRTWQDITDEELISCDAALSHFDETSFVYYLPAYLLFAVRNCSAEWSDPAESTVGSVVFAVTHRTPYTLGRFKRFSPEQRAAVIAFLELISEKGNHHERPAAQKALERYWKTDEASKPFFIVP
jgi:hypothetical protein